MNQETERERKGFFSPRPAAKTADEDNSLQGEAIRAMKEAAVGMSAPPPSQKGAYQMDFRNDVNLNVTRISKNTTVNSGITSEDSIEVFGTVFGDIHSVGKIFVSSSATIKGTVSSEANVIIEGIIEGNVRTEEDLFIKDTASITGDLKAVTTTILGHVQGNVDVSDYAKLGSTSTVIGNLSTKRLSMEDGAVLNGNCAIKRDSSAPQSTAAQLLSESL